MADIEHEEWLLLRISTLIKDIDDLTDTTLVTEDTAIGVVGPIQNYINTEVLPLNPIIVIGNLVVQG